MIDRIVKRIIEADAIIVGAGSGLSTSAGLTYSGPRFEKYFADFIGKYHFSDMYTGGFYPFENLEEHWAWWSRHIYYNRYVDPPRSVYQDLLSLLRDKNYFVLTTNVDHQFQRAGFDKARLFYTQGDYGLFQCSAPCCHKTYENEEIVRKMVTEQKDMRVPGSLVPYCPVCGKPMSMNLRSDASFVEDEGWHRAADRYSKFLHENEKRKVLFLELGVGGNTPGIIKYPFWQMTYRWEQATLVSINANEDTVPNEITDKSICVKGDIGDTLELIKAMIDNDFQKRPEQLISMADEIDRKNSGAISG